MAKVLVHEYHVIHCHMNHHAIPLWVLSTLHGSAFSSGQSKKIHLLFSREGDREGNGTPLQYSCLENPMGRGAWWAAVHGVSKSQTWLSNFTFTFHFDALEKEMATHSSVLAWRIPGTGEPGGLPSMRSHRVGHDWRDLAAAPAAERERLAREAKNAYNQKASNFQRFLVCLPSQGLLFCLPKDRITPRIGCSLNWYWCLWLYCWDDIDHVCGFTEKER